MGGITVIPLFGSIKLYAKEKVRLRRIGRPMHDEFDLLIGVTALQNKLTLVTDNIKDFKNGLIPYANLEKPEKDLPTLVDKNETVIKDTAVEIIIDYPLTNAYKFDLFSKKGFTRAQLLKEISRHYFILYPV